ncbi:uncharacterized protein B0H64DRAFT_79775 [Chaetomium fimeti]|uniref:Uncharacterized protein n=1 Tax=Chaetomium fimeti TaxID=1854472 RepID=A0AAE0LV40_9PEZI|nr:hypothetical protein B0H64DRAFT_79775 [Chaetomium fimeti]
MLTDIPCASPSTAARACKMQCALVPSADTEHLVGKRDPLSEQASRGRRHVELPTEVPGNGPVGRRSEAGHTPGTRSECSGGAPSVSAPHRRYMYKYLSGIRGRAEESSLRMTRQHHKITTGTAVRQAPPRTRHENRRTESSDRQSPVSLRCRFLIVNGRTGGFSLGRRLATWGCCVVVGGPCVWDRQGQGTRKARDPLRHFFIIYYFLTGKTSERCGIRLQVEVPQRNIVASQPVTGSQ